MEESMGKIHRKIVAAGVCCLMTGMLTGCGSDTTKITEGMQLVETLDYQGVRLEVQSARVILFSGRRLQELWAMRDLS